MKNLKAIHVLDPHIVDKIAAGEVIERPASVVKELIENSIDAETRTITIEIENGGKKLIRVADNGLGIPAKELHLAFTSHATSKITSDDDLFNVHTLGFRGEALASIASVSQIKAVSRHVDEQAGAALTIEGGTFGQVTPTGAPVGTNIEVRNLFFNVPVRRKFMKSVPTETGHISDLVLKYSLAHPFIGFHLTHNSKEIYNLPPVNTVHERITNLFGEEFAASLIPIQFDDGYAFIEGYLAPPVYSRTNAKQMFFCVNGRFVRDNVLIHSVKNAYSEVMANNRYPIVFILITLSPREVDVNVHPTKREIRFKNSGLIYSAILSLVKENLKGHLPELALSDLNVSTTPQGQKQSAPPDEIPFSKTNIKKSIDDFLNSIAGATKEQASFAKGRDRVPSSTAAKPESLLKIDSGTKLSTESDATPDRSFAVKTPFQIHNSFIIEETDDGFILVDQHALHERILFEKLSRNFARNAVSVQKLLIPHVVNVSKSELAKLMDIKDVLNKVGFDIDQFSSTSIAIHGIPDIMKNVDLDEVTRAILEKLDDTSHKHDIVRDIIESIACKAALKAGNPLQSEEMTDLLNQRMSLTDPDSCPHGRPIILKLTLKELYKHFKRT